VLKWQQSIEGCSNYPKADIRTSNMPSSHESAMYKFGLLDLLRKALF